MRAVVLPGDDAATPTTPAEAQLRNRISKASMAGNQTVVRVNGVAAQRQALDAYAEMLPTYGGNRRYRIEASQLPAPEEQKRIGEMGIVVADPATDKADPFYAMQRAVLAGRGPQQALKDVTTGPAYAAFAEDRLGTLEPGKWADFILVDSDMLAGGAGNAPPQVLETWVGGKRVFVKRVTLQAQ